MLTKGQKINDRYEIIKTIGEGGMANVYLANDTILDRKVAINAMFYALEEGYYAEKGYYPENIEKAEDLPWIDPNLFTDPYGVTLWNADADSNYSYDASNCEDGKCKSYTLRSTMEKEDDYVKTSRN